MLRTLLFAAALAVASSQASAHGDDYFRGDVIGVVPQVSLSFGSLRHDGFRGTITLPPPFAVVPVLPRPYIGGAHWRDDDRGSWRDHDRRHWRHRDHERWDDRRHWKGDKHRHGRRHGHDD